MFDFIHPHQHVALRLPSGKVKIVQVTPSTLVNLGKYGTFNTNQIIGRPYYLTFEILDRSELRILKASEIHAETLLEEAETDDVTNGTSPTPDQVDGYGLLADEKTNVNIIDNTNKQKLTYAEIEAFKSDESLRPRELIEKIMANHEQIDQKTAFSLAKYTLRKLKKYMKQFTVLPLDVPTLTNFMMEEKDFTRILEIRNETLGLIASWANVHASGPVAADTTPRCRYLVVDDTGGLIIATLAERMGVLHHHEPPMICQPSEDGEDTQSLPHTQPRLSKPCYDRELATSNTITMVHTNQQPNLALMRFFAFDPNLTPSPYDPSPHPLHTHLRTLNWLQLIEPSADSTYSTEIEDRDQQQVENLKGNQKSIYYRKRRRWLRTKEIVDSTRQGGFDALIIASHTDPTGICKRLVPLLAGGAQVVVYNTNIEPLMELCDAYGQSRRAAYLGKLREKIESNATPGMLEDTESLEDEYVAIKMDNGTDTGAASPSIVDDPRFLVDPTLLLTPVLHKSCAREWQVLPGRTHPLMTAQGGAEGGYVVVSTRVLPVYGTAVQARGKSKNAKKRPTEVENGVAGELENADRYSKRGKVDEDSSLTAIETMDT